MKTKIVIKEEKDGIFVKIIGKRKKLAQMLAFTMENNQDFLELLEVSTTALKLKKESKLNND